MVSILDFVCPYRCSLSYHLLLEVVRGSYFYGRDVFLCHEVFFRVYKCLALDIIIVFVDSLGLMAVDEIRKHLLGLTHSNLT